MFLQKLLYVSAPIFFTLNVQFVTLLSAFAGIMTHAYDAFNNSDQCVTLH
jgi:hypothetical protein